MEIRRVEGGIKVNLMDGVQEGRIKRVLWSGMRRGCRE